MAVRPAWRDRAREARRIRLLRPKRWPVVSRIMEIGAAGAVLLPAQAIVQKFAPRARPRVPSLYLKLMCSSLNLQVRVHGHRARGQGVLFVSNHLGWADIPVLGSKLLASFVSKAEVNDWGVFGLMARLQGAIYVSRENRLDVGNQRDEIVERLDRGGRVILFAEGTNSDGTRVLPFKTSLFSVVEGEGADFLIQPVSLAYTRVNGMPVGRGLLPHLAWPGDVELKPHIADFMRLGKIRAEILLHPAVRRADFTSRKELARHCQAVVAAGYERLMRGGLERGAEKLVDEAA